jgi:hypothetical protein
MSNYQFTNDWFEKQKPIVERVMSGLNSSNPLRILEIGAHEGRSTVFYIDNYLHHPESRIISIDPFDLSDPGSPVTSETRGRCEWNVRNSKFPSKHSFVYNYSIQALPALICAGERFDYVVIDGSHLSEDVLTDACLSFHLVKTNGILLFDDYLGGEDPDLNPIFPKLGIDAFLSAFRNRIEIVYMGYHVVVRRLA